MKIKRKIWFYIMSLIILPTLSLSTSALAEESSLPCEHEYVSTIVEPTCTMQGYTKHTCGKCGKEYRDNYVEPKGHDYEEIVVEPTCTQQGFTTHYCKTCGYQYSDNYVQAKGHKYTDVVYAPTCTEEGYTIHKCENCKHEYKDSYVQASGHNYEEVVTPPTCEKEGYTTYTCSDCGHSYVGNKIPAKGHNYIEKVVQPTCVSYGYTEQICECGDRHVTNYVKPIGHDYEVIIIPATEETTGYTKHTCKKCGHTFLSDFVTSGDGGYIPKPEQPPEHVHNYVLTTLVDRLNKTITLEFDCLCGESGVDLLSVLFIDNQDKITALEPVDGVVDYSEYNGQYEVSVIDTKGNVLKTFNIGSEESQQPIPPTPNIPDVPDTPIENEKHTHEFKLETNLDSKSGILKLEYKCLGCEETCVNLLTVIVTDSEGNGMVYFPNEQGQVDLHEIKGDYKVSINDEKGNLLKEINSANIVKPEKPNKTNDEKEIVEKQNSALGPILIVIAVLLIAGAVTVIIIMSKKNKNKKENKEEK